MRRVNTFIPIDSEVVKSKKETEESSKGTDDELKSDKSKKAKSSEEKAKGSRKKMLGKKRAGKKKQQESSKRQRIEDDKETDEHEEVDETELKKHLVIVKDDDIAIDAIPLATKTTIILQGIDREDCKTPLEFGQKHSRRKLKIQKMNIKFRGGLLGLKRLHGFLKVTTAQETRIREKNMNGASSSKANYVDSGKNNKGNDKKRKGTWNLSKDNKKDKKPLSEVVCYKCGEKGHIKRYCMNPKKKNQNSNKKDESANAVEQDDTTEITAMVSEMNIGMIHELHMASMTTTTND
ncbi:retrovirus-related pol polyprotein from transposon TNT 1-94 [Tanacetum coccineum]